MSNKPTRRVAVGTAAGASTVVLVWAAGLAGIEVPPEVASAITTLFMFGFAWAVSEPPR